MAPCSTRSISQINNRSSHGVHFQKTQQSARIRTGAGLHRVVPQPDCPDSAGRNFPKGVGLYLGAVLAYRSVAARGGFLSTDLRSVASRLFDKSRLWSSSGVGTASLPLSLHSVLRLLG